MSEEVKAWEEVVIPTYRNTGTLKRTQCFWKKSLPGQQWSGLSSCRH